MSTNTDDTVLDPHMATVPYPAASASAEFLDRVESRREATIPGTRTGWPMRLAYLAGDLIAIAGAIGIAIVAIDLLRGVALNTFSVLQLKLFSLFALGLMVVAVLQRTYAALPPRPIRLFQNWVQGATAVAAIQVAVLWLMGTAAPAGHYAELVIATVLSILMVSFNRALCRMQFGLMPWWGTRLIVVGSGRLAEDAVAALDREPQWGLRPVAVFDSELAASEDNNGLELLDALAREMKAERALIAVDSFEADGLAELLCRTKGPIRQWIILPPLGRSPSLWLEAYEVARQRALVLNNRLAAPSSRHLKRALDLSVVISAGLVILPLIALLALLIRLTSPGPIFYGSKRIGRNGRRFKAWKFRTMFPNADAMLTRYLEDHPDQAAEWKAKHKLVHDPRITPVGRWLRTLSLDELPQLWNVLVDDMSLVGPRPMELDEINRYAERYEDYIKVQPGITGLWQVSGRNNTTYEERLDLVVYYVRNWSLWLDLYILAATVKVVLRGEGAC